MYAISIVSYRRRHVLHATLQAVWETTRTEAPLVVVTDNNSGDGTAEMLSQFAAEGRLIAHCLAENVGTSGGHNANLPDCRGRDLVRLDDKTVPLAPGWLTALKAQADAEHAILAPPYDPSVANLNLIAPCIGFVSWNVDGAGVGGPLIYFPAEVMDTLGAFDEIRKDTGELAVYGWDDVASIQRAALLGWHFGFTLRVPVSFAAGASPERRAKAMEWHPAYMELIRQYREAERDIFIPLETTLGWQMAQKAAQ